MRTHWSSNTSNRFVHVLLMLSLLLLCGALPALAQETPADILKKMKAMVKEGRGDEAKSQYCVAGADPKVNTYCTKALDGDIKDFEDNERSQINGQGKVNFNAGDYIKARNVFTGIKSKGLQSEKQKWLTRIDQMEKGKAAASAGRVDEAASNLRPIAGSGDPDLAGAKATAAQLLDGMFQNAINAAKSKAGSTNKADLDAAKRSLDDANKLKPGDGQIGGIQSQINAQLAKLNAPVTPAPAPAQPQVATNTPPPAQKILTEADLARAIDAYYKRNYSEAERLLNDYLANPGGTDRQTSLAYFYRGASKAARDILRGKDSGAARADFQHAKSNRRFSPPRQYVSKKILDVYNQA